MKPLLLGFLLLLANCGGSDCGPAIGCNELADAATTSSLAATRGGARTDR